MPSHQNGPLPRLKPQPLHISMMIHRRQEARNNRILQDRAWKEMALHVREEAAFHKRAGLKACTDHDTGKSQSIVM